MLHIDDRAYEYILRKGGIVTLDFEFEPAVGG